MPGPASMSASTSLKFAGGILYADTVYKRLDPSSNHGEEPRITLSITSVGYNTPCTKGSLCLSVCDCMYLRVLPSFEPSCLIGRRNPAYGDLFGEVAPRLTSFLFRKEVTRGCSLGQTRCLWFCQQQSQGFVYPVLRVHTCLSHPVCSLISTSCFNSASLW